MSGGSATHMHLMNMQVSQLVATHFSHLHIVPSSMESAFFWKYATTVSMQSTFSFQERALSRSSA